MNAFLNSLFYSVKQAYISLKQKPGFVLSVVSTMGITLGALLCVLTLGYVMFFKPLPYPEQDKLFMAEQLQFDQSKTQNVKGFSYPALVDFYHQQQIFSSAALVDYGESSLIHHPDAPIINSTFVTPEWFSLMAAQVLKGRIFEQTEALNTYNPVAVISYKTWQQLFSADQNIIGRSLYTNQQNYTIVGVLGEGFIEPKLNGNDIDTHIWFPWDYNSSPDNVRKRWWGRTSKRILVGNLSDKYSVLQAQENSSGYVNRIWQERIAGNEYFAGWQVKIQLTSFKQRIIGDIESAIYLLIAGTVCLTLIASLNIINLLFARFTERQHQIAIHAALGAKKSNLFSELVIENLLLFSVSLLMALFISAFGFTLLQQYLSSFLPRVNELSIQVFTGLIAIGLLFIFSLFFSILLLSTINYKNLVSLLMSGNKGGVNAVTKKRRKAFVLIQVSIASILVFLSSATAWKSLAIITFDDGIRSTRLQSLEIRLEADKLLSRTERNELVEQVKYALEQLPEVQGVSHSSSPYLTRLGTWSLMELTTFKQVKPEGKNVDEHYFSLSGQKLIAGELLTKEHVTDKAKVLVINQALAKILSTDENVLGHKLSFGTAAQDEYAFTIIGIVNNHHIAGQQFMPPRVYRPMSSSSSFMIETLKGKQLSRDVIEQTLNSISPIFKVYRLESFTQQKNSLLMAQYITVAVSLILLFLTMILAGIGLYGILSYSTQMRRFEIGTRLAVGAKRSDIMKLIIKDNVHAIVMGVMTSLVGLLMLSYLFKEQLTDFVDWELFPLLLMTIGLICAISFIACYLPLRHYINKPALYSLRGAE